jgi:hypothetical protein
VQRVAGEGTCADVDPANGDALEYNRIQPCPSQTVADFTLSPAQFADGARHSVSVVATDAAGQASVIGNARGALAAPAGFFGLSCFVNPDLDAVGPRTLNGVNAGRGSMRLSFLAGNRGRKRYVSKHVIRAGVRQVISGRLTNAAGAPISGARVWRVAAGSPGRWQIVGSPLTTSTTGAIRGSLPQGPSRDIRLVYFPCTDSSENVQSPVGPRSPFEHDVSVEPHSVPQRPRCPLLRAHHD